MDQIWFLDVGTSEDCGRATSSWWGPSALYYVARAFGEWSRRTSTLGAGYCHGSSREWWNTGYLGMVPGERKVLVLRKEWDMGGHRDGVAMFNDGGGIICYDKEVVWGVATADVVAWFVSRRVVLVVCNIMVGYLEGTSEHGEWFEGVRWSVYKESLSGVGWFPFLLSLLVLLYSKASTTLTQPWFLFCPDSVDTNFKASCPDHDITVLLTLSPTPDPTRYSSIGIHPDSSISP